MRPARARGEWERSAQAFPPALGGQARKGTCQDTGGKPGECSVPRPGGVVLRERELSARPAAAGRSIRPGSVPWFPSDSD